MERFSLREHPVDMVVIAEKLPNVSRTYHSIRRRIDSIPVYVFE